MNPHSLFYYPYGSFSGAQIPLLKATALYFDKLSILDPEKASSNGIGVGKVAKDVELLEQKGILERIAPEEVLLAYENAIAEAIRADLQDPEFLELCESSGRSEYWTLALAKVPNEIRHDPQFQPLDRAMQRLMSEHARSLVGYTVRHDEESVLYDETDTDAILEQYQRFAQRRRFAEESLHVYDEVRTSGGRNIEYRYADYPLALGEAIMVNHALFAGLLYTQAMPITDDPFHKQVLNLKIKRVRKVPEIRQILEDRAAKQNLLAVSTLTDTQLNLPSVSPQLRLEDILEYREQHASELQRARERLGWVARQMEQTPWSREFEAELEHKTIPEIAEDLEDVRKTRDAWFKSKRGTLALKSAGIAVGAASTILSLILSPTPLLPVALGLVGSAVVPGLEIVRDWKQGKKEAGANGLNYLLKIQVDKRN